MINCEMEYECANYVPDFEKIISENIEKICDLAVANSSEYYDGVVQIGVDDGMLYDCSLGTNEVENPANRVVEVYRIEKGFVPEECAGCIYCDWFEDCDSHYGSDRCIECAIENLVEDFRDRFDDILSEVFVQMQEFGYDL